MVNKTAIGILCVVVFSSLGVGILIGMQLGGTTDGPVPTTPTTAAATDTPVDDQQAGDGSAATATPAGAATERHTSIPPRQFDEGAIESHLVRIVNEERTSRNGTELSTGGTTAASVSDMASNHSAAMANSGGLSHEIDGDGTASRYRQKDLYERCKFKSPEGSYISQPDEEFELIGSTYAGTAYEDGGSTQFNGDEQAVARAIVDGWTESSTYGERLHVRGPTRMGVGVEVASDGAVFATVNVCA